MEFNLEERLINFAVLILEITEKLPETKEVIICQDNLPGVVQLRLYIMAKLNQQNLVKTSFTR